MLQRDYTNASSAGEKIFKFTLQECTEVTLSYTHAHPSQDVTCYLLAAAGNTLTTPRRSNLIVALFPHPLKPEQQRVKSRRGHHLPVIFSGIYYHLA